MDKCSKIEFSSIEFGVNIELPYNPQIFIDCILKLKGWRLMEGGVRYVSPDNYEFKIYYETIKRPIPVGSSSVKYKEFHVLRFEIKIHKTQKLNQIMSSKCFPNIRKFSDLIDIDVFHILGNYILEEFQNLIIIDRVVIDDSLFKEKDRLLFQNGCNIDYWNKYESLYINRGKSPDAVQKQKNRELKRFKDLIEEGSTLKQEIGTLIKDSLKKIFNATEKDIENFRSWIYQRPDIYVERKSERLMNQLKMSGSSTLGKSSAESGNKKTKSQTITVHVHIKTIGKDIFGDDFFKLKNEVIEIADTAKMSALYYSDKVAEPDKNKCCPVTRLSKFLNDPRSKFLSSKEVEYYYHNYRAIYYRELYCRLPSQWHSAPLKKQFKEIAHAIRNEDSNPRNNEKKRLGKKKDPEQMSLDF